MVTLQFQAGDNENDEEFQEVIAEGILAFDDEHHPEIADGGGFPGLGRNGMRFVHAGRLAIWCAERELKKTRSTLLGTMFDLWGRICGEG